MSTDTQTPTRRVPWLPIAVAIVFGLFYAYSFWQALGSLLSLPAYYEASGIPSSRVPWGLLIAGVAAPVVIYVAALLVGRRQGMLGRSIILFVGLAATAAIGLAIIELPTLV
jgi:hypothetical protein